MSHLLPLEEEVNSMVGERREVWSGNLKVVIEAGKGDQEEVDLAGAIKRVNAPEAAPVAFLMRREEGVSIDGFIREAILCAS